MSNWSPYTLSLIISGFFGPLFPLASYIASSNSAASNERLASYEARTRRMAVFLNHGIYQTDVTGFELGSPLDGAAGGPVVGRSLLISAFTAYYISLVLVTVFIFKYGRFVTLSQNVALHKAGGGGAQAKGGPGQGQGQESPGEDVGGGSESG
ncbi:hypothetical protein Q9L58_010420 [Maublancomyces gigas]|uniref:ATP synthase F0 subunit 6 n=1 Tax=Discina gigas TaxID=1032678 RepID=A0ABR3G545_9PEZI